MEKALFVIALVAAVPSQGAMVTARWGSRGRLQHPGTLRYESAGEQGTLMVFTLSALPKAARVYRSRLFFFETDWKDASFDIVPASREGAGEGAKLTPAGDPLRLVAPWYRWFDATEAVKGWLRAKGEVGLLWLRKAPRFNQGAAYLEIACEGQGGEAPKQVSGVEALYRSGQVFITFEEIDPPDGGEEAVTWGELAKRMKGNFYGPVPTGGQRELRYHVYQHDARISASNIGEARLLAEVLPGSAINTRFALQTHRNRQTMAPGILGGEGSVSGSLAVRVAAEPGKPVEPGTGLYVHTVEREGKFYYAVATAVDGVTNTVDISPANTAGPIEQRRGDPEPVLYKELVTPVRGATHHQQWYSQWTVQPLSPWPARYDVAVWFCPQIMAKPAPLDIPRIGWNMWPWPPDPDPTTAIGMVPTSDDPVNLHTGLHDAIGTLKGFEGGTWKPFFSNRQDALVKWMCARWPVDPNRISAGLGCWGIQEIKRGHIYAWIYGGGLPEVTKGWQAWQRACGIWGTPQMYQGRPDDENPYVVANVTDWLLAHPQKRLPYVWTSSMGGHEDEMGWPPYPRFLWAMMETKRPFLYDYSRQSPVGRAILSGQITIRRDQSLPAFRHCSLDDNLGDGERGSGLVLCAAQVNGYVLWDSATVVDEPERWEITIWLSEKAPLPDGTVDLTPRYCQKFSARPAQQFAWTNTLLPGAEESKPATEPAAGTLAGRGTATADKHGLVTIEKLKIVKARHRISIRLAK